MAKKKNDQTASVESEIATIQEEARDDFDLSARLSGRAERKKTVPVYSDAEAGEILGYAVDQADGFGIRSGLRIREGLLGELDALEGEGTTLARLIEKNAEAGVETADVDLERAQAIPGEIKSLQAQIAKVRKRLKETSFDFTLRYLPEIIEKSVQRESRKALKIKGKGIPDAMEDEYKREYTAQMLAKSTEKWFDHETGEEHTSLSLEKARSFQRFLPPGQFARLDEAMVKLTFQAAIANSATDDADF